MTGKHYQWHKKWHVDLAACSATHDSGLVVRFEAHWDARRVADNLIDWRASINHLSKKALDDHGRRLMREADRAWEWVAGRHVSAYVKKCTAGVSAEPGVWKITAPEPADALERLALDLFLDEARDATGVDPTFEVWQ